MKGLVGFHPEDHERPLMGFGQSHLGASAKIHFSSSIFPLPKDFYTSLATAKEMPLTHLDAKYGWGLPGQHLLGLEILECVHKCRL